MTEPASDPSSRRKTVTFLVFLLAFGVAGGIVFRGPIRDLWRGAVGVSDADWDGQIAKDAGSLLELVRPDRAGIDLRGQKPFWDAWDARRGRYPDERLAELRARLHAYLDFMEVEHGECAEIYRTGMTPDRRSAAADTARAKLKSGFGELGETLVKQADELREEAYRSSPKVAAGFDPAVTDFVRALDDLRKLLPTARRRADELTEPLRR
ncbi:MAG: hypothetical protein HMLKMBBP_03037 [Planctomycetes bacterium]|nr:hypothetical protein [Planctomycetota bacterium]